MHRHGIHHCLPVEERETGQVPIPSNLLSLLYTTALDGQLGAHGQDPVSKEQVNITHRNKIDTWVKLIISLIINFLLFILFKRWERHKFTHFCHFGVCCKKHWKCTSLCFTMKTLSSHFTRTHLLKVHSGAEPAHPEIVVLNFLDAVTFNTWSCGKPQPENYFCC